MKTVVERTSVVLSDDATLQELLKTLAQENSNLATVVHCDTHLSFDCRTNESFCAPRVTLYVYRKQPKKGYRESDYVRVYESTLGLYPLTADFNVRALAESKKTMRVQILFGRIEVSSSFAITFAEYALQRHAAQVR